MTIYTVPTSKAREILDFKYHVVASDEGEAIAMACGEYLATGEVATVIFGENGFLNALDAIITLSQLHNIPVDIKIYMRSDEPQHKMVADYIFEVIDLYQIKCTVI